MISSPRAQAPRGLRRWGKLARRSSLGLVRTGGAGCFLLGLLALLGWRLQVPALQGGSAGAGPMQPLAAIGFLACGIAVVLHATRAGGVHRRTARGVAQGLGLGVVALAVSGRLTTASAAAFACAGIGLAALPLSRWRALVQVAAAAAGTIGILALAGHFWGALELGGDDSVLPAMPADFGFVLLGGTIWLGAFRLAPGRRSVRFLLDPIELSIMASFVGALGLLTVVGGLNYQAAAESARTTRQLAELERFHGELTEVYADATTAVVAARTFLVTGERRDAVSWIELAEGLDEAQRKIGAAPDGSAGERAAVAAFAQAIGQLSSTFRQALDVYRKEGAPEARLFLAGEADRRAMAAARAALLQLEALARAEQQRRQAVLRQQRQETLHLSLVLLMVAALMLAAVFTSIRRGMEARAQAERALRRRSAEAGAAHRFLESVIQNIPHFIFIKDAKDLRFERINRTGERLFGCSEDQVIGRTDHDFFPPAEAESFIRKDREVLAGGTVVDIPEEEIHTAHEGVRLLHTRKLPLVDAQGRATHLVGISEDVTDVRQKERQIRELNAQLRARAQEVERISEARSVFLATMSHEIRTPMNAMIGMVELLGLGRLDDEQQRMLAVIADSGRSLLRIIDDVLDFSKIEAGKLELQEEVASIADIVEGVRNMHAAVAGSKGLAITTRVDPSLCPAAWVDPLRLRQILGNLVSNAIKFTREGHVGIGVDVVRGDAAQQQLRLSVTDTGVGISPRDQQRLFQPFVQVGDGGTGTSGGTGLGLVISRQLAGLMGASLDVRSAPGQGTTFSLRLRVRIAPRELLPRTIEEQVAQLRQATARMRPAPTVCEAEAEGTLVLVVDDHPVNRLLLQQQLGVLGYASEAVEDGGEALGRWASGRFALVLTDCQMPGIDGYELARRVRSTEAATGRRRTPVIACTAMALADEVDRCSAAGMDDVLFKPVELSGLLEKMRRWLPLPGDAAAQRRAAAAGAGAEDGPVDVRMLQETWGSGTGDIEPILLAYAQSAREDQAALREAMAGRDAQGVMRVAHRMLGASKMVGAHALAESCELLNGAAREGGWERIRLAMDAVEAEYRRVMAALQAPVSTGREPS